MNDINDDDAHPRLYDEDEYEDEDEDEEDDDNDDNIAEEEEDDDDDDEEEEEVIIAGQLSSKAHEFLSMLDSRSKSELLPYIEHRLNDVLNNIAEEYLPIIRTHVGDWIYEDYINEEVEEELERNRSMTTTIVDKDWHIVEKQFKTTIQYFPDILIEERHGYSPIQWMTLPEEDDTNNLRNVSLIPLTVELGIELQQFDDDIRGGLLLSNTRSPNYVVLHHIISYVRKKINNDRLDECFLAVWERLKENNNLRKKDIQQYGLLRLCGTRAGCFQKKRLQYLVDWDPMALSTQCYPEFGTCIPIHWGAYYGTQEAFNFVVEVGMNYFPKKFGFLFCERTQEIPVDETNDEIITGTPFQLACKQFGREEVIKVIMDQIDKHYPRTISIPSVATIPAVPADDDDDDDDGDLATISTASIITTTTITESSLLLLAVTDESIHLDGVYMLLRKDPNDVLLRLHQHLAREGRRKERNSSNGGGGSGGGNNIHNHNHTASDISPNIQTSIKRKHESEGNNNDPGRISPTKKDSSNNDTKRIKAH